MTTLPLSQQRRPAAVIARPLDDRLKFFPLLLIWLFYEFGRPARPFGVPLVLSLVLFLAWLVGKDKQWSPQTSWFLALLGVMALGIPLAANTYAAFWTTRDMAVLFLCICLPLQAMATSIRKVRLWVYTFLAITVYVGGWAALHGGYGPSGASGSQDENYVAALMGMAAPFAYFSFFITKRWIPRLLLGFSIVVFVAAIALGENPSRGGFLGLCAVALYCLARSPRKMAGFGILTVGGVALLAIAGPAFWKEIDTSADYQTGTGNIRLEIWKAGLRMWLGNPILGAGAGNFRWVIGDYQSASQWLKFNRSLAGSIVAHSTPVELFAELGLAGALVTAVLVWRTWSDLGKLRAQTTQPSGHGSADADLLELRCYADAVRGGLLAILVNGVFLSLTYFSHLWLLIALGSALPFVYRRIQGRIPAADPARPAPGRRTGGWRTAMGPSLAPADRAPPLGPAGRA